MNLNIIRGKMAEQRISQNQMAKLIGISSTSLSRKLNGITEFTITEASALSKQLNISEPEKIFFED